MAAEILTPTCEVTGLPLPILPTEPRLRGAFFIRDAHKFNNHHLFHPNSDPALANARGRAIRGSRIMKTRMDLHRHYHQTFTGPPLPVDDEQAFQSIVFSVAGVMPREGIEMYGRNSWDQRSITPLEYKKFSRPGFIQVEKGKNIARFISEHALNVRENELISSIEVEEFVDSKTSYDRKRELASNILDESLDLMLMDLNPTHKKFREEGSVVNNRSKTLRHAAKTIVRRHAFGYFSDNLFERAAYQ